MTDDRRPENRIVDDLSKLATSAMGTMQGLRAEMEGLMRQQLERMMAGMDMVSREEFEALRSLAMNLAEENEQLKARLDKLDPPAA